MKLVNDIGIWEAITAYGEGDAPKSAGFRWVRERVRWQAPNALAALELVDYASEADRVRLQAHAEKFRVAEQARQQAEAEKVAAAVQASRATDADIIIPAPEGLSYLGYQKAGIAYSLARRDTLIADEMGLGKTIQALGVINVDAAKAHNAGRKLAVLVVAPKIALRNWVRIPVIMNTCSHRLFEASASGGVDGRLIPPTVVGSHSQSGVVKRSIASIAAWWFDRSERLEVKIDDSL